MSQSTAARNDGGLERLPTEGGPQTSAVDKLGLGASEARSSDQTSPGGQSDL